MVSVRHCWRCPGNIAVVLERLEELEAWNRRRIDMSDIVERLLATYVEDDGDRQLGIAPIVRKINPDGDDGAAEILALLAEVERLSIAAQSWQDDFIQENHRLSKANEEIEMLQAEASAGGGGRHERIP